MYSLVLLDVSHHVAEQAHHFCTAISVREDERHKTWEVTQANKLHVTVLRQESGNKISLGVSLSFVDEV